MADRQNNIECRARQLDAARRICPQSNPSGRPISSARGSSDAAAPSKQQNGGAHSATLRLPAPWEFRPSRRRAQVLAGGAPSAAAPHGGRAGPWTQLRRRQEGQEGGSIHQTPKPASPNWASRGCTEAHHCGGRGGGGAAWRAERSPVCEVSFKTLGDCSLYLHNLCTDVVT